MAHLDVIAGSLDASYNFPMLFATVQHFFFTFCDFFCNKHNNKSPNNTNRGGRGGRLGGWRVRGSVRKVNTSTCCFVLFPGSPQGQFSEGSES